MIKILKIILKKVKLRTIIVLIVLLTFNAYAWFIYATRVSGGITAHISSWNVEFQAGEDDSTTNISIDVDRIYPGMETYTKIISAKNSGETKAKLSYEIKLIRILGTTYSIEQGHTQDELLNIIKNNFPFSISISIDNEELEAGGGDGSITFLVEWPLESGDDDLDTYWGEASYEYYKNNPNTTSINIVIEMKATQQ